MKGLLDLRNEHGERALVHMCVRLDAVRTVKTEFAACLAQLPSQLSCRKHGNIEDLASLQQLLSRGDDPRIFVNSWTKLLLQVADAIVSLASVNSVLLQDMRLYGAFGCWCLRRTVG